MTETRHMVVSGFIGVVLMVFAALNVIASQVAYPPLMDRLLNANDGQHIDSVREFLTNMEGSDVRLRIGASERDIYKMQAAYFNSTYDNIFAREVDVRRLNIDKSIEHYEGLLAINPLNPHVLMKLSLLHAERGDAQKSDDFANRARAVDPNIEF